MSFDKLFERMIKINEDSQAKNYHVSFSISFPAPSDEDDIGVQLTGHIDDTYVYIETGLDDVFDDPNLLVGIEEYTVSDVEIDPSGNVSFDVQLIGDIDDSGLKEFIATGLVEVMTKDPKGVLSPEIGGIKISDVQVQDTGTVDVEEKPRPVGHGLKKGDKVVAVSNLRAYDSPEGWSTVPKGSIGHVIAVSSIRMEIDFPKQGLRRYLSGDTKGIKKV